MHSVVSEWGRLRPIFALSALRRRPITQLNTDSTHILNSTGRRRPLQPNEAAHVINQVHHADLRSRTCHADGTHEYATHPVFLIRKYVLEDRKSTRLNSSHLVISYAVFCLKK